MSTEREFLKSMGVDDVASLASIEICDGDGEHHYVLECDQVISEKMRVRTYEAWEQFWGDEPTPKLLLLDAGVRLRRAK